MTKHTITADFHKTYEIKRPGDDWRFTERFSVSGDMLGIHVAAQYDNTRIDVAGRASGKQAALYTEADDVDIVLADTSRLTGGYGIVATGNHLDVVNGGQISAKLAGAVLTDDSGASFRNAGDINGQYGVVFFFGTSGAANAELINGRGARIIALENGVQIGTAPGISARIENHGRITGGTHAISGGDGNEIVINDGTMKGEIALAGGDDRFDNRGGVIVNTDSGVRGEMGNDTLITDSAAVKLIEAVDQGIHDTVRSTVSYTLSENVEDLFLLGSRNTSATGTDLENIIHGNSGNNVISGLSGLDELYGHKGADMLTGGGDGDIFHFLTGDGRDTVTDFENGLDKIDVSGWNAISSFDDLMQNHIEFVNGDAIITSGKDSLTLKGAAEADLDAGDFVFGI